MDILFYILIVYIGIGAIKAIGHINSGRVGRMGYGVTFIFITLLWPIFAR